MISNLASKIFGSRNERIIKRHRKTVEAVNKLEPEFEALSDEQLAAKTLEFRQRHTDGESLDQLLPEAFAAVREAGKRVLHMRHFDVQLIGGMVLHNGKIAEMRTGEGKTLVATLAAYLNAIPGKGVHVITVNDYLASRDAEWMGRLYNFLGMTTGVSLNGMDQLRRNRLMLLILPMEPIMNSALIICAITWRLLQKTRCNLNSILPSWMRSTPF